MNKLISVDGRFDGHAEALKRYTRHCPMQHDQGYIGSHWTPPSGNYMLRIVSAAARATINKTMMQHVATLMAISMAVAEQRYYTPSISRWRRFVAFIKATKRRHRASTRSDITQSDTPTLIDSYISLWKRAPVDMLAPYNNRGYDISNSWEALN